MKKFKDIEVKPPDSKFEWLNYFIMAVYSLGFIDKGYKLYKGIKKPAPSPEETPSLEPQMVQENRNMNSENV